MIEKKVYSVSQVNRYIRDIFDTDVILNDIWIKGEISNIKEHTSGHIYFTLKDSNSAINAIMFSFYSSLMPFKIENGMDIVVYGHISSYEKSGKYQIYAEIIEPLGVGSLNLAFEQLKNKLKEEGLFDSDFKRDINKNPRAVAVITSPTGAAVRDIIKIIKRRAPSVEIIVCPALVQGENSAESIVRAIKYVNAYKYADTIILGRGGGSIEDLWSFNEEKVARAIFASEIPVISAVGHETDFTIADFVADLRAPTPSAAAELAVNDKCYEKRNIQNIYDRLNVCIYKKINEDIENINIFFDRNLLNKIDYKKDSLKQTERNLCSRLNYNFDVSVDKALLKFKAVYEKIEALSPINVLKRGYTAVFDENKKSVVSALNLKNGDNINIKFFDGDVSAVIRKSD